MGIKDFDADSFIFNSHPSKVVSESMFAEMTNMTIYALEPVEDYSGRQVEVISRMISPEAAKDIDAEKLLFVGQKTARFVEGALENFQKARFVDQNNQEIGGFSAVVGDREIRALSNEEFQKFRKIHEIAIRIFQSQAKKAKEQEKPQESHFQSSLIMHVARKEQEPAKSESIKNIFQQALSSLVRKRQESSKRSSDQARGEEQDKQSDIQKHEKEKTFANRTAQRKSSEDASEEHKVQQALKGTPLWKILGSFSLTERAGPPNPNA